MMLEILLGGFSSTSAEVESGEGQECGGGGNRIVHEEGGQDEKKKELFTN